MTIIDPSTSLKGHTPYSILFSCTTLSLASCMGHVDVAVLLHVHAVANGCDVPCPLHQIPEALHILPCLWIVSQLTHHPSDRLAEAVRSQHLHLRAALIEVMLLYVVNQKELPAGIGHHPRESVVIAWAPLRIRLGRPVCGVLDGVVSRGLGGGGGGECYDEDGKRG